jgi:hypothetical protein
MTARRRFWSIIAKSPTKIAASRIVIPHSDLQSDSTSATGGWKWPQRMPESNQRVTFRPIRKTVWKTVSCPSRRGCVHSQRRAASSV